MSSDLQSKSLTERLSGKWQVPLLLFSMGLLGLTIYGLIPEPDVPTVDERLEFVRSFKSGLLLEEAEALTRDILHDGYEQDLYTEQELAPAYALLADIQFESQARKPSRHNRDLVDILANYAQAEVLGHTLEGDAYFRRGQIYEWMNLPRNALEQYETGARHSPSDLLEMRKRALALRMKAVKTPRDELYQQLDALVDDARQRPDILAWAVEQKVTLLAEDSRLAEAQELLDATAQTLDGTEQTLFVQYLTAYVYYKSGEFDEAELVLRSLRNKLNNRDDLHARAGWLLGHSVLRDSGPKRPLEAVMYFSDVLDAHPSGEYVTASKLGMAEALSDLQRFDEALAYYEQVLDDLKRIQHSAILNPEAIRDSLRFRSRLLLDSDHPEQALAYLQLAAALLAPGDIPRRSAYLGDIAFVKKLLAEFRRDQADAAISQGQTEAGEEKKRESHELFVSAAEDYLELSSLKTADEQASSAALWQAADMYDLAGVRTKTIELLEGFLLSRPNSNQIPLALYRLGQAFQAEGRLDDAIGHYQHCIRDFTRTDPAQRSLIPLADCYLMQGTELAEQAEQTLLYVLEETPDQPAMFTPQSAIYRDALFKIGDLYSRDGRYEEAIGRLDEALRRYPNDRRVLRATFLLADAYRHSGLNLEKAAQEQTNSLRREELQIKKRERLHKSENLFGQVIRKLSGVDQTSRSIMRELQLKLSYIYRADCAYDLSEYERALDQYREVARVYDQDPITLAAHVQIISCLEHLGWVDDIGPALKRAKWLTDKIEAEDYGKNLVRKKKEDWHLIFDWLATTARYK